MFKSRSSKAARDSLTGNSAYTASTSCVVVSTASRAAAATAANWRRTTCSADSNGFDAADAGNSAAVCSESVECTRAPSSAIRVGESRSATLVPGDAPYASSESSESCDFLWAWRMRTGEALASAPDDALPDLACGRRRMPVACASPDETALMSLNVRTRGRRRVDVTESASLAKGESGSSASRTPGVVGWPLIAARRLATVSYTHLRAHET